MPETGSDLRSARFGYFAADLRTGELRKHDRKIRLNGRPFQILGMLLEHPGELVTREEIRARLWPADTFVDFEHGMNSAIRKLRGALGDSAKKPRYVETLPRRGYRFIASVDCVERAVAPHETPASAAPLEPGLVGQVATIGDGGAAEYLLLPVDEEALAEKQSYEAAKDDLGIMLLVAAEKLLLVPRSTKVKILEAQQGNAGCKVRILEGQFIGVLAFAPRQNLQDLKRSAEA